MPPKNPLSIFPKQIRLEPELTPNFSIHTTLADLSRIIHEPARLAILTVLSASVTADFTFLQTATGLSKGNLSVQLTRLEEAALITIAKSIERRRTLTTVALTSAGHADLLHYWRQMDRIRTHTVHAAALRKPETGTKSLNTTRDNFRPQGFSYSH